MKKIKTLNSWRHNLDAVTSEDHRVDADFFLVERYAMSPAHYEPFTLDVCTAIILLEGTNVFSINMVRYEVSAPAMIVMMPGQIFQYIERKSEYQEMKALVMSDKFFNGLFGESSLSEPLFASFHTNPILSLNPDDTQVLELYFSLLSNLLKSTGNPYRLKAVQALTKTLFYGYFYNRHSYEEFSVAGHDKEVWERFRELLKQHYKQERQVAFYADKLCFTPKYLSRIIREISGRSVSEWIDYYIIMESKALLRSTDMTIQQLSMQMNFASQALFGKFFKRVTGLSPKEYRQQNSM